MQRSASGPAPEQLYTRRLAARALALVLDSYGLSTVALRFAPDSLQECLPGLEEGEVLFGMDMLRRWEPLVTVYVHRTSARVIIERLAALIRGGHRREWEGPESVGIHPKPGQPDLDVEVDLGELIAAEGELLRTAPVHMPHPASRPVRVRTISIHGEEG